MGLVEFTYLSNLLTSVSRIVYPKSRNFDHLRWTKKLSSQTEEDFYHQYKVGEKTKLFVVLIFCGLSY